MIENKLTALEVCSILKSCRELGVAELEFGALYVTFVPRPDKVEVFSTIPTLSAREIAETQAKLAKKSLELDEMRLRDEQLGELVITDPLKYEELLRNGELSSDVGETEEA